jgi:phage tail sheath gpL-like
MPDKNTPHAWLVGLAVAALWAAMQMVAVIFADPPNKRSYIIRAFLEKVLAMGAATFAARISAPWATQAANGVISWVPFKTSFQVDPLTAAAVVAVVTLTLIADPAARSKALALIKSFIPGVAK